MSTKYVLECPGCRKKHYVQSSQAGTSIACKCRRTLNIPSMRHLRDFPVAEDQPAKATSESRGGWGFRQAFALVGLLVGTVAAALAIYLFVTRPDNPRELAERRQASEEKQLDAQNQRMTIAKSFELWANFETNGIVIPDGVPADLVTLRGHYQIYRFRLILALVVATLSFVLSAAFWLWPAARGKA